MDYFLLEADERNPITQYFNRNQEIGIKNINRQNAHKIPPISLVEMYSRDEVLFPPVLSRPFFMVSKACVEVIGMYVKNVRYRFVKLYCEDNDVTASYFLPILEEVACLDDRSELNPDKSVIMKMILNRDLIGDRFLFRIAGFSKSYVIARMELIDSLLRRDMLGLKLTQVPCVTAK
ncbi:MAG: hypothetical protein LBV33_08505 [Lachnospiraceae bacterium]|jgi:hypothetical protein|nr:hypothetical protein [Lachnospiraceae bacterium]